MGLFLYMSTISGAVHSHRNGGEGDSFFPRIFRSLYTVLFPHAKSRRDAVLTSRLLLFHRGRAAGSRAGSRRYAGA